MSVSLEEVLDLAKQLSALDKLRLIERIAPEIVQEVATAQRVPRESLRGLWRGIDINDEDLAEVRREMWGQLPAR
jgi:hypothetical protein